MANNCVQVITLSSDEEAGEATLILENEDKAKVLKRTARKSMNGANGQNTATVSNVKNHSLPVLKIENSEIYPGLVKTLRSKSANVAQKAKKSFSILRTEKTKIQNVAILQQNVSNTTCNKFQEPNKRLRQVTLNNSLHFPKNSSKQSTTTFSDNSDVVEIYAAGTVSRNNVNRKSASMIMRKNGSLTVEGPIRKNNKLKLLNQSQTANKPSTNENSAHFLATSTTFPNVTKTASVIDPPGSTRSRQKSNSCVLTEISHENAAKKQKLGEKNATVSLIHTLEKRGLSIVNVDKNDVSSDISVIDSKTSKVMHRNTNDNELAKNSRRKSSATLTVKNSRSNSEVYSVHRSKGAGSNTHSSDQKQNDLKQFSSLIKSGISITEVKGNKTAAPASTKFQTSQHAYKTQSDNKVKVQNNLKSKSSSRKRLTTGYARNNVANFEEVKTPEISILKVVSLTPEVIVPDLIEPELIIPDKEVLPHLKESKVKKNTSNANSVKLKVNKDLEAKKNSKINGQLSPNLEVVSTFLNKEMSEVENKKLKDLPERRNNFDLQKKSAFSSDITNNHKTPEKQQTVVSTTEAERDLPPVEHGLSNPVSKKELPKTPQNVGKDVDAKPKALGVKQVTSPKLSLKRNRTVMSKDDEPHFEQREDLIKLKQRKLDLDDTETSLNNQIDELIPSSAKEEEITVLRSSDSIDNNGIKFTKLLEFCTPLMKSPEDEVNKIKSQFLKALNCVHPSYVDSKKFSDCIELTRKKVEDDPVEVFVYLHDLMLELKLHKQKKKVVQSTVTVGHVASISSEETTKKEISPKVTIASGTARKQFSSTEKANTFMNALSLCKTVNSSQMSSVLAEVIKEPCEENHNTLQIKKTLPSDNTKDIYEKNPISLQIKKAKEGNTSVNVENSETQSSLTEQERNSNQNIENLETLLSSPKQKENINQNVKNLETEQSLTKQEINTSQNNENLVTLPSLNELEKNATRNIEKLETQPASREQEQVSHNVSVQPKISTIQQASCSATKTNYEKHKENKIKELEKYLSVLDKAIQKFQAKELSFDDLDDDDSIYIQEDRYKKKFNKVYKELCKLRKCSSKVGRQIEKRFRFEGTRFTAVNEAVERFINKRKPKERFPNFVEIRNLVDQVNNIQGLGLNTAGAMDLAKTIFQDVGQELKQRREFDEEDTFGSYLTDNFNPSEDPAESDEVLRSELSTSVLEGEKRIAEIIDKYAEKQYEESAVMQKDDNAESDLPETDPDLPETDPAASDDDLPDTAPNSPRLVGMNPVPDYASTSRTADSEIVIDINSGSDNSTDPNTEPNSSTNHVDSTTCLLKNCSDEKKQFSKTVHSQDSDDSLNELPSLDLLLNPS